MEGGEQEKLRSLIGAIQVTISDFDKTSISNELFNLGLDQTYAALFVENVIRQIPPIKYHLSILSKLPDGEFKDIFPTMIKKIFVEQIRLETLIKEYDITAENLSAIRDITRQFMNELARSRISENKIKDLCKESGLSETKIYTLVNTFKINLEFWTKVVTYSNTQDTYVISQRMEQQNETILHILSRILEILKKSERGSGNHDPYQ